MIEIHDIKTEYQEGDAFSFQNIVFEKGRITSIIGRNGSGKSTLLKSVAGILPYEGTITINGNDLKSISSRERARYISYLPQNLKNLNIDVETLAEHGRYPWHGSFRRLTDKDRKIIKEALAITDMEGFKNRNLSELSGGERQRAYLAMVIAQDTPMILLDEPTTFMDMKVQQVFMDILKKLKESGRGIAVVLHNLEQSFAISDMIYLIDNRAVAASGEPEILLKEETLFRSIFGVALKKEDNENLVYPYAAVR